MHNDKFYFINLGCRVNLFETNVISNDLIANGYILVDDIDNANIVLINTCSVTNMADRKSKNMINKAIRAKQKPIVVVMGCFSQMNKDYFKDKADIIIGNKYKNNIVELLQNYKQKQEIKIENLLVEKEFENFKFNTFIEKTRAFLKIQDGCNFMCSYCIIPFSRGRQRSAKHEAILQKIEELVKEGFYEIVLTGVNTAGYSENENYKFYDLLNDINKIKGDFRIRISSVEPFQIDQKIVDLLTDNSHRFCQHLHICLQSACDKTLKTMNRKYLMNQYFDLVNYIRSKNELFSITTDYIVGFVSETKDDFIESKNNLLKIEFADMHIFPYSPRKQTKALEYENVVSDYEKKQRFAEVYALNKNIQKAYLKKFINKTVEVIFENSTQKNVQKGHSNYFFNVFVKTKKIYTKQKKLVLIKELINDQLFGEVIN